jgi:carboxypeptidase Q
MKVCLALLLSLGVTSAIPQPNNNNTNTTPRRRQTPEEIIEKYSEAVSEIVRYITVDEKGRAFNKLSAFCDTWGHRLQGSQVMEDAIDGHKVVLEGEGFIVTKEPCTTCPHWERGAESATLVSPLVGGSVHPMRMMGLGRSVGTPPEGITAEVLVVQDFEALELVCAQAEGKIVLWNIGGWFGYGTNNAYRTGGAVAAAKCGALASLTRSVTPFSLNSAHTGSMSYEEGVPEIPAACLTIEDTELITRMQVRAYRLAAARPR